MSFPIYDASVPVMLHALNNLSTVLDKASAHCEKEKIDPNALLSARLYPDMFALTRQVQVVSDGSKGGAARLAGAEAPKFPDTESSFAELKARLDKTAAFLKSLEAAKFAGAEERAVELKFPQRTLNFRNGWDYLRGFVLPNLYFHSATAYDILRHNGVKLGKGDFLGNVGG
ncbi:MAG TPA: DUF1993 domain-containing protein [Steroidobacteraceae bacterium]